MTHNLSLNINLRGLHCAVINWVSVVDTSIPYLRTVSLEFQLYCFLSSCLLMHLRRSQKVSQVLGRLPPSGETRIESLALQPDLRADTGGFSRR